MYKEKFLIPPFLLFIFPVFIKIIVVFLFGQVITTTRATTVHDSNSSNNSYPIQIRNTSVNANRKSVKILYPNRIDDLDKNYFPSNVNVTSRRFRRTKLEGVVIEQGKADYLTQILNYNERKELLCGTFLKASNSKPNLYLNIAATKTSCDWAIIFYGGELKYIPEICSKANSSGNVVLCRRAKYSITDKKRVIPILSINSTGDNSLSSKNISVQGIASVPKTVLYVDLLPILPNYRRIFLLDEDISLQDFEINEANAIWSCTFFPPPLITQPLIHEDTQYFKFVTYSHWKKWNIQSSAVGIVEQQVPMFESIFFQWFVTRVLALGRHKSIKHGADWPDRTWCNAAKAYGTSVLGWKNYKVPCSLLIGTNPVHHLDGESISIKRRDPETFRRNGYAVVKYFTSLFPSWVLQDPVNLKTDPTHLDYSKKYPKCKKLNATCVNDKSFNPFAKRITSL